jgi:selenocysteine lyase/cysteine desulfurase
VTEALVPRSDFIGLDDCIHLYTAAECPMLRRAAEAMAEYTRQKSRAEAGRANHAAVTRSCRETLARLLGVEAKDVALLGSASDGINAVAGVIDWQPGDNVVINDLEFPSVALPWLRLRDRGVEVRVVRHQEWDIPTDALLGVIDARTRLLALSHVSYVNGLRHDVETIGQTLKGTSALFLLDVTQTLGVLPVPATAADFVVASTYKWLLGTHGLGVLVWNRSRISELEPAAIGWYAVESVFTPDRYERYRLREDAGRFETGYLSFPAIYALNESVPYLLALDPRRLSDHVYDLGDCLIAGLNRLGLTVTTPVDRGRRGPSVTFVHDDAAAIGTALAERAIHVWAGDGRVRASTHAFNSEADVAGYLDALAKVLPSR